MFLVILLNCYNMNLISCEHPVHIVNPYTKVSQYVPCGKCKTCLSHHNSYWVTRLTQEMLCWKYTAFVTLTYDEDHIPTMVLSGSFLVDSDSGLVVDSIPRSSLSYLRKRKSIGYVNVRDCQLFIKRLRFAISSLHKVSNLKTSYDTPTIRYFLCSEYGPTTHRPHYHCLFFFNSDITSTNFSSLLCKAWKNGIVDFSYASTSAASYVASYVNSFDNLPSVFKLKELRPFTLCSKCPPIGTLQIKSEEIQKIFHTGLVERMYYERSRRKIVSSPLWRSTENFLFPKVRGFGDLSHADRVAVYGCVKFYGVSSESELKESIERDCKEKSSFLDEVSVFFDIDAYRTVLPSGMPRLWSYLYDILVDSDVHPSVFTRLYYTSCRVLRQCEIFDCSLDYYVSRIENYYSNKQAYMLRKQLEFEQEFADKYGSPALISLDLDFIDGVLKSFRPSSDSPLFTSTAPFNCAQRIIMDGFGVDLDRFICDFDYRQSLDVFRHPEYRGMVDKYSEIFRRSSKTKKKNDYLELHPEYRVF